MTDAPQYFPSVLLVAPPLAEFSNIVSNYLDRYHSINNSIYPHIQWYGTKPETIKIETVRSLKQQAGFASTSRAPRFFVLENIEEATVPAQQALLKLLEEPPANTQYLLCAHSTAAILPTILSRCVLHTMSSTTPSLPTTDAQKWVDLYASLVDASIHEKIEHAEMFKNREEAQELVLNVSLVIHSKLQHDPTSKRLHSHLLACHTLKKQLESNCNPQLVVEAAFFSF